MSFMTHMVTTACAIGGFVALAACRRTGKARWAFVAGAAAGLGSLIRPLDGAIVACLLGLMAIGLGARRLKFSSLVALGLGTVLAASLIFPYNQALTGDPMNSPLVAYRDKHFAPKSNAYGFGPERGLNWAMDPWPGHTPFEALINVEVNASTLNADLFGWSTGSLLLIGVIVLSGGLKRRDYHMLFVIAAVLLAYAPYWFAGGPDYGPRYWFLILIPCVALTARGLEWLETRLSTSGGIGNPRVGVAVAVLALLTVVNYFPWRSLDKYRHYLRMRPDVRAIAAQKQMGRSLVLVRGDQFPDYTSAAIYNPLDLNSGQPVYAWDRDATTRAELLRTYSDRPVWIVEGPTITKAGYRVIAGPLKAADLATGALHLEQASAVR
jgi:hypothetical protein